MAYSGESWRLILLGKTGVGKSASGNTILGERVFRSESSPTSVTMYCSKETREVEGRTITIVDTPGLNDTNMSKEFIVKEFTNGIRMLDPGPHAFLLVINLRHFTVEERNIFRVFQSIFGEGVHKHMIVLFTRGDDLEYFNTTIKTHIENAGRDLQYLISSCGGRYHVFNNRRMEDRTQVKELFRKIQSMLSVNNYMLYRNEMFTMEIEIEELKKQVQDLQRKNDTECLLL